MNDLSNILSFAKHHCRFYREQLGDDIKNFPVINRKILSDNIASIITAEGAYRDPLIESLTGKNAASVRTASEYSTVGDIIIEQTSGSAGIPLRLPKTLSERRQLSFAAWAIRARYDPLIKPRNFLPLFHRTLDSPLPIDPFDSRPLKIVAFYKWLFENNIRWIHAPPALISYHASVLRNMKVDLSEGTLRYVEMSGSRPNLSDIEIIRDVMGAKLINQFGTRESWAIGYASDLCPFRINDNTVHIEILDDADKTITECEIEGNIAVTSKVLKLLPLIRYKTGDRARWLLGPGCNELLLQISEDRNINMLYFNGKLRSGNVLFKEIFHKIDHNIGYCYTDFIQVRKTGEYSFTLKTEKSQKSQVVFCELRRILRQADERFILEADFLSEFECHKLAVRKPYLFINEYDSKAE